MATTDPLSRTAYFEAHEAVAVLTNTYILQNRKVAQIERTLRVEQAVLAVMDLQLTDLLAVEDRERSALEA